MKYVLFICLTILLFNCKNTDQAYIQTIIQEWTNKKIIFPDDIQAKIVGRDTNCNYLLLKPIKLFRQNNRFSFPILCQYKKF